jgi:hypothetical protein
MEKSYRELLLDPRWQRKRLEVLERDDWQCVSCGRRNANLQIDHKRYERGKPPWDIDSKHLQTLCEKCHSKITELRRKCMEAANNLGLDDLEKAIAALEQISTVELSSGCFHGRLQCAECDAAADECIARMGANS